MKQSFSSNPKDPGPPSDCRSCPGKFFLQHRDCSGLDEPGGRGCPLRTVAERRHLGCVLCSPMYRCVSLRAKACPQGTSPSARRPYNRSFSCPEEKKLPSCNRTKAVSRFYHLLQHTQAHRPFICVPLTRELTSALTLYVFQGLQLGSDLR